MMVPRHLAGVSIIIWILCGHKGAVFPLVVHDAMLHAAGEFVC